MENLNKCINFFHGKSEIKKVDFLRFTPTKNKQEFEMQLNLDRLSDVEKIQSYISSIIEDFQKNNMQFRENIKIGNTVFPVTILSDGIVYVDYPSKI